jgi:hypothetical protein
LPGKYDAENRVFTLTADLSRDRPLAAATLIHGVVTDLLHQNGYAQFDLPELVDLAVLGTGLGMLQSNLGFVNQSSRFWDSTRWDVLPRPFLDDPSLAYATALTAWVRAEGDPAWARDLRSDVKKPMQKGLKFLQKTGDSFFSADTIEQPILNRSQHDWVELAASRSASTQIVALRHFEFGENADSPPERCLLEKLRSGNRAVVLHAIAATQRFTLSRQSVVEELRVLIEHRDDEVRAAAVLALARLEPLDEHSIDVAAKMLDSNVQYVSIAGLLALSTLDTVPDHVLQPANRGLLKSLQACNFDFVGIYIQAFDRWLDDPKVHFENLLAADSPEYLEIAIEALENLERDSVEQTSV